MRTNLKIPTLEYRLDHPTGTVGSRFGLSRNSGPVKKIWGPLQILQCVINTMWTEK